MNVDEIVTAHRLSGDCDSLMTAPTHLPHGTIDANESLYNPLFIG